MAINFKLLVESLLTEQFDPSKTFQENVKLVLKLVYPNADIDKLYNIYFFQYGADIQAGGGSYKSDDSLRKERFFWPVIDIGNRVLNAVNSDKNIFLGLKQENQPMSNSVAKQHIQYIEDILNDFENIKKPENYTHFTNYRLNKLNADLSQLTVQKYNNLTVLKAITEIALQRGIKDKSLIEKVLSYPVDYLGGTSMLPKEFDSEIVNIGGVLLTYYKGVLQSTGVPADQLNTVGTASGANTPYGKEYLAFIKGASTSPAFQKSKTLGDLQSAAPNVYAKIQEYTLHVKRGDKPSGWQIAGKAFSGFMKGLEDIGSALERF